jgi:hypothetical protein
MGGWERGAAVPGLGAGPPLVPVAGVNDRPEPTPGEGDSGLVPVPPQRADISASGACVLKLSELLRRGVVGSITRGWFASRAGWAALALAGGWAGNGFRRARAGRTHTRRPRRRGAQERSSPRWAYLNYFEQLEVRCLLSTVFWNVDGSGNWNTPTNWSTGQVPGINDNVVIDRSGGNALLDNRFTITVDSGVSVNSIQSKEAIDITGGSLAVAAASEFDGTFTVENSGSLVGNGPVLLTGTSTLNAGTISGTVTNTGTMTLGGSDHGFNAGTFTNQGTVTQTGGRVVLENGSTFNNSPTGLFDIQNNDGSQFWQNGGGPNAFINAGTLRKSVNAAGAAIQVPVDNLPGGIIDVEAGSLALAGANNSTGGVFEAALGTTLDLVGGNNSTYSGTYTGSRPATSSGARRR